MHEQSVVYAAHSRRHYGWRRDVADFVFARGAVPLNPLQALGYAPVARVRQARLELVHVAEQLWHFGKRVDPDVLVEMQFALALGKPVRCFTIGPDPARIVPLDDPGLLALEWSEDGEFPDYGGLDLVVAALRGAP